MKDFMKTVTVFAGGALCAYIYFEVKEKGYFEVNNDLFNFTIKPGNEVGNIAEDIEETISALKGE